MTVPRIVLQGGPFDAQERDVTRLTARFLIGSISGRIFRYRRHLPDSEGREVYRYDAEVQRWE